ncbi:small-conductance mechanosensitive channel [Candidatus Kinetoplastibacterium desouzaii TCC079E]|uniref:Small-conductance mechanosensitive channel n=1 Tax=Candidatus Kinetoplastidibacterium desouzai TCC079E TaxID=1208919 RepID=M1L282_9PROT|nr:mechanosensitive ion channel domain-containing protein [Candidatus Kinetoplastibacterium desouzaii]AGF46858.1 small-conductance mechanosensitive channel [Candidatus Kinetoplastibacterium desouzaii TCC079E]
MSFNEIIKIFDFYILKLSWIQTISSVAILILFSFLVQWLITRLFVLITDRVIILSSYGEWHSELSRRNIYRNILHAVPFFVISEGIKLVPNIGNFAEYISRITSAIIWIHVFSALVGSLSVVQHMYSANARSIKVYIQVCKLVLVAIGIILVLSVLIDRSPLWMISGLGALSAVLLLVFKDTLLSLVASTQLTTNDMLRIGDWIEMPQSNADGYVRDIALHTVKIQNWDNTVVTVPTYKLFSESYRNYRQMFESGGRRIKRTILLDVTSLRTLNEFEINDLSKIDFLNIIPNFSKVLVNHTMNISIFRFYAISFLRNHKELRQDMPMLVRMMEQKSDGIPMEIYCFTALTAWVEHERIQSEIFDHFISVLSSFKLRLYQRPSGPGFVEILN